MSPAAFAAWEFACGGITALALDQLVRAWQARATVARMLAESDAEAAERQRRIAYRAGMDLPGLP